MIDINTIMSSLSPVRQAFFTVSLATVCAVAILLVVYVVMDIVYRYRLGKFVAPVITFLVITGLVQGLI